MFFRQFPAPSPIPTAQAATYGSPPDPCFCPPIVGCLTSCGGLSSFSLLSVLLFALLCFSRTRFSPDSYCPHARVDLSRRIFFFATRPPLVASRSSLDDLFPEMVFPCDVAPYCSSVPLFPCPGPNFFFRPRDRPFQGRSFSFLALFPMAFLGFPFFFCLVVTHQLSAFFAGLRPHSLV